MWCCVVQSVGTDIVGEPAASILHWAWTQGNVFELTVHTLATGEFAEWSVWTQQLPLDDLPWVDPTLSAEWFVMIPNTWNWVVCYGPRTCNKALLLWTLTHIHQFAEAQANSHSYLKQTCLLPVALCWWKSKCNKKNSATWLDFQFSQCFISLFYLNYLQYRNVSCIFLNCDINFPWFLELYITDSHLFSVITNE